MPKSLLLLLFLFSGFHLIAQELDSLQKHSLNAVVVTGTRLAQQKSKITTNVSILSRKELESAGHTNVLSGLANKVPGLFMNSRNMMGFGVGPNSAGSVTIRGVGNSDGRNSQVLILIDGQPQFMGLFAHPINDAYTTSDVEQVEIVKGASSVLYGSNAMGGAINLITRKTETDGLHGNGSLSYGSYNSLRANGHVSYKKQKNSIFASVNREHTDGFRKDTDDSFDNTTAYLKFQSEISNKFTVGVDGNLAEANYNEPFALDHVNASENRNYLRGRTGISVRNTFEKSEGALMAFYNWGEHEFSSGFNSTDFNRGITFYQNLKLFADNIITVGVDYKQFGGEASNEKALFPIPNFDTEQQVQEFDVYGLVQHTFADKISLSAGGRITDNSQFGSQFVPSFGASVLFSETTNLKLSASKAFRSPSIADLYFLPTSNGNLQPEELWTYEASVRQLLADKKLALELTVFWIEAENLLTLIPNTTPGPPETRQNAGELTNRGIEFQGEYFCKSNLSFSLGYSYLNTSSDLLFAPEHEINFQTNYQYKKLSTVLSFKQVSGLNNSLNPTETESYSLLNLRLAYQFSKSLNGFVEGGNLTDTSYEIIEAVPSVGANVMVGVKARF